MIKKFESFNEKSKLLSPVIIYYSNGQKKSERWSLNGERHKEDGPAFQTWYENGQKYIECWYLNGKIHREDGPAYNRWYDDGKKWIEDWLLNNIDYSREEWIDELKKIGSKHYKEQKMLFDLEKYNL